MEVSEVRITFYDEEKKHWCVDVWHTDDDNEEGEVVAYIDDKGKIQWLNEQAKDNEIIQEEINVFLTDMENGEV